MGYKASPFDRRAFPRVPREIPIQVLRPDYFSAAPIAATLVDISQNGTQVLIEQPIPEGEWIVIRPAQKGAGYGQEITAIVDRNLSKEPGRARLACRFPEPLDYSVMRLFL